MTRYLIQALSFIMAVLAHFIYSNWRIARVVARYSEDMDYILTYFDRFQFVGGLVTLVTAILRA